MTCPSCRQEVEAGDLECPFCGIIFSKWGKSVERPKPRVPIAAAPPTPSPRPSVPAIPFKRVLRTLVVALAVAGLVIGGYWFFKIRPRLKLIEDPYYGSEPSRESSLKLKIDDASDFDRSGKLAIGPLGAASNGTEILIANRNAPGGLLRLRPVDDRTFTAQTIPVIEPEYSQNVSLSTITWNGSTWVGYAEASWFQRTGYVFTTHDPYNLRITELHDAPELLGCLAWDGNNYWAGSRKNTEDSGEEAWLYRLDRSFEIVDKFPPPGVGCQGLAWDGSRLWWADVFSERILVLDVAGASPKVAHEYTAPFDYLSGIVWDGSYIWVTEYDNDQIHRLNPRVRLAWLGGSGASSPLRTAVASATPSATPVSAGEREELVRRLRSDDWADRMQAETRMRELRIPIDFDREQDSAPSRGDEEMEMVDWHAELRGGSLYLSWDLWFGPLLFEDNEPGSDPSIVSIPIFRRYTVSVEGGTLANKVERVFEATPGNNRMDDVLLASGLGPGKYEIECFMHTQYIKKDGTGMILNASAMGLDVEK